MKINGENFFITRSESDTFNLGIEFGKCINPGSIILLHGDLGSGKTVFVRGVCHSFGIKSGVRSPSFTIMNEYEAGDVLIVHADLYRLDQNNVRDTGLDEYAGAKDVILFVEWPDRWNYKNFEGVINIYFNALDENTREIKLS